MLQRPKKEFLEDFGTSLVTAPGTQGIRGLLRFCGMDFVDFMDPLDDLSGRVKLAVPEFILPKVETKLSRSGAFTIFIGPEVRGMSFVLVGILRAMADDYGSLVHIDQIKQDDAGDEIAVTILDLDFDDGRDFLLAGAV